MKILLFQHSLDLQKMEIIKSTITKKKITKAAYIHIREYYVDSWLRFMKNL